MAGALASTSASRPIEASPRSKMLTTPAERDHRPVQHREVGAEGHELAEADGPRHHLPAAQPQHHHRAGAHEQLDAGIEGAVHPHQAPVAPHVLVVHRGEALELRLLLRVGAHHAGARQVLLHEGGHVGQLCLHALEPVVDAAAEVAHQQRNQHERQQREQQQAGADAHHQRDRAHEGGDGGGRVHDAGAEHHPHRGQVAHGAAHQIADPVALEVAQVEARQVREQVRAQRVLDLAAEADQDGAHPVTEEALDRHQTDQHRRVQRELRAGDGHHQVVDGQAQDPGRGHGQRGGGQQARGSAQQRAAVAREIGTQASEVAHQDGGDGRGRLTAAAGAALLVELLAGPQQERQVLLLPPERLGVEGIARLASRKAREWYTVRPALSGTPPM
jgi:hypothetical protein